MTRPARRGQQNGRRGQRIRPEERETDDTVETIGQHLPLPEGYEEGLHETEQMEYSDKYRRNNRSRIAQIFKYWKVKDPDYYEIGVKQLTAEEQQTPSKYYFQHKEDLIYQGLNVTRVISFLMNNKHHKKGPSKGMLYSWDHMRKYRDAIQWGAKMVNQSLPTDFHKAMDRWMSLYKVEYKEAKKAGNAEDTAADPIPFPLYKLILKWAIDENNPMVWFWSLSQWSFVARSASIDPLGLSNFKVGPDSLIGKYDNSKADRAGERLSEKNIFANPYDWTQCFWTGLGVWLALRVDEMKNTHEKLFLNAGNKLGSAATKYCEQVATIAKRHSGEVQNHMDPKRFNPYGLRKGGATHVTSGSTHGPPITSVCRRGEWSMGDVIECYWHFSSEGDRMLGRILAGLDPNHESFDVLAPHWTVLDQMADPDIKAGMMLTYGRIIEEHSQHLPVLLRAFACVIYHSESLLEVVINNTSHDFSKLAILQQLELLHRLRQKVTLEPTEGVMSQATGIPPHVRHARELNEIREKLGALVEVVSAQQESIAEAIKSTLEERAAESGLVTVSTLEGLLEKMNQKNMEEVSKQIENLGRRLGHGNNDGNQQGNVPPGGPPTGDRPQNTFYYNDKWNYVPEGFRLPTGKLRECLPMWLTGMVVSTDGSKKILPFRKLKRNRKFLIEGKELKDAYTNHWGIFEYLERYVATPADTSQMPVEGIDAYYQECVTVLKERVSYCFRNGADPLSSLGLSSWTLKTRYAHIEKHGTEADKQLLPERGSRNKPHTGAKRSRKRKPKERPLYSFRQEQNAARRAVRQRQNGRQVGGEAPGVQVGAAGGDAFANAFPVPPGGVNPSENDEREQRLNETVQAEVENEQARDRQLRRVRGDATGTDGTVIFVDNDTSGLARNHGDNSRASRDLYMNELDRVIRR